MGKISARKGAKVVLSVVLAFSLMVTGVPWAMADEGLGAASGKAAPDASAPPAASDDSAKEPVHEPAAEPEQPAEEGTPAITPERISETVELGKAAEKSATADAAGQAGKAPQQSQAVSEVPLASEAPKAQVGTLVFDGLEYSVNPEGTTVTLTGFYGDQAPTEVVVPTEIKTGDDTYSVSAVTIRGGAQISAHLK